MLRSDDFRVTELGANLPKPLRWVHQKTNTGLLHPLQPPSLLSVEPPEHTRYRKLVSSVFTSRAVAALRDRVEETAKVLLDDLADRPGAVDIVERYCSQLPVTVIGDILGVPDQDRPQILKFGELGRAEPRHRAAVAAVPAGTPRASSASTPGWPSTCSSCGETPATTC